MNKAYDLISEKLTLWLHELIKLLPNIALAAVILVIGFFIAKWLKKFVLRFLTKTLTNLTLVTLFTSLIYIFLLGIVIFSALSVLQLSKAVTSLLAGAGILGLALAFAFQDIASNFMSGIFLSIRKPVHPGDVVNVKGFSGTVEEINLRDTVINTFQGQIVIVPNKDVLQNPIENFTILGKRRVDLTGRASFGDDLEKVKTIVLNAVKNIEGLTEDEITMFYTEFGDSSINFVVRIWVDTAGQGSFLKVRSDAIMLIKKAFDENDLKFPFPISTLNFGTMSGTAIQEMELKANESEENNK